MHSRVRPIWPGQPEEGSLAVYDRDPATHRLMQPILFFKGYQAFAGLPDRSLGCGSRAALIWLISCRCAALRCSASIFTPAARIGTGVMIDHAHSIVIGETAVVGNDVSMLHSVTLAGPEGRWRPSSQDRQRRDDRRRRQGAGKYQRRPSFAHRRRFGRAERGSALQDRGGRAGAGSWVMRVCSDPSSMMNQLLGHEDLF